MAAIDIGNEAINRSSFNANTVTYIEKLNPANDTGTLTSFEIYLTSSYGSLKIGTFSGSGTTYTNRDYETFASVSSGSKQTLTGLNCDVVSGDFIGFVPNSNQVEKDNGSIGNSYYKSGDQFGTGEQTSYTSYTGVHSLYGTGETVAVGNPYYYYLNQ